MSATITLSFGGVDFCLNPIFDEHKHTNFAEPVVSVASICEDEIVISLNKFAGTLRVTSSLLSRKENMFCGTSSLPVTENLLQKHTEYLSGAKIIDDEAIAQEDKDMKLETVQIIKDKNLARRFDFSHDEEIHHHTQRSDKVPLEDTPSPDRPKTKSLPKTKGQQRLNFSAKSNSKAKNQLDRIVVEGKSAATKRSASDVVTEIKKKCRNGEKVDTIFESKSSSGTEQINEDKRYPLNTLGQSMPSQSTDVSQPLHQPKEIAQCAVNTEANTDVTFDKNYSFSMEELSQESFGENFVASSRAGDEKNDKNEGTDDIAMTKYSLQISTKSNTSVVPAARWGHTMEMIDHKRLIVYGGQTIDPATLDAKNLGDIIVYDILEHTWTEPVNCKGVPRTWHSSNFLPDRQLLLCFGGDIIDDKTGKTTTTDEVMVLDTEIMLWYPPAVTGNTPKSRSGHTASLLNDSSELVIFGGVSNGKWTNSVSILETNRWHWSSPKIMGDAPRPRSYHSATALGDCIIYIGGNNGKECFNSVHVLESKGGDNWAWSHPKVGGKAPSPRTGHTATLLDDNKTILIYGGWDPNIEDDKGDDTIFGDSFLLDTTNWTWRKGPRPRFLGDSKKCDNFGAYRVGHSAVLAPGADGAEVLVFGGRLPESKFACDFQSLSVAKREGIPSRSRIRCNH
ncbi:hypothetical protein ACHAXS_005740 [Conticribra weissflogii]